MLLTRIAPALALWLALSLNGCAQERTDHGRAEQTSPSKTASHQEIPCFTRALQKAYHLKARMDEASRRDIELLQEELRERMGRAGVAPDDKAFVLLVKAKLKKDRAQMTHLHERLVMQPLHERGSWPFRSSLGKLVGRQVDGRHYRGILEEAEALLEQGNPFSGDLKASDIELKNMTPVKTVLLYALITLERSENLGALAGCPRLRKVKLIYPTELPGWVAPDSARDLALYCDGGEGPRFHIPNNGYVFGGDDCSRGADCSSFCCEAADSSVRLSTEMMAIAAKVLLNGEPGLSLNEKARLREFRKAGLDRTLAEFAAIDARRHSLGPGDLVVWRYKKGGGHAVVYDRPVAGKTNEFVAVELNRDDDKTSPRYREGVGINVFRLLREDAETFVLRRRPH